MQLEIKIETQKGEINGKYGLIWGTRAFRLAEKMLAMEMDEIFLSVNDDQVILTLTYCAMLNWVQNQDESAELPFSIVQFENWLNEQPAEVNTKIADDYKASTLQGKSVSDRYEEINAIYEAADAASNITPKDKIVKKKASRSLK